MEASNQSKPQRGLGQPANLGLLTREKQAAATDLAGKQCPIQLSVSVLNIKTKLGTPVVRKESLGQESNYNTLASLGNKMGDIKTFLKWK